MTEAKYVVFDVETNGLFAYKDKDGNPIPADADGQPRLASFAAIIADAIGNEISREKHYIKPDGWVIDGTKAGEINGLTDAFLVDNGVPVKHVLDLWNKYIDLGLTAVAFNSQFDTKMMRAELRRAGLPDRFEETLNSCAMRSLSPYGERGLCINRGYVKLYEACEFFGIKLENAHDAMTDAEACLGILKHLIADGNLIAPKVHYAKKPAPAQQEAAQGGAEASPVAEDPEPAKPAPDQTQDDAGTDLILAPGTSLVSLFTEKDEDGNSVLLKRIEQIEENVRKEHFTTDSKAGRERIASVAYNVARTKTGIDKAGKELGDEWRTKLNAINADRKAYKDRLQALQDEVRKPLNEWEKAEEERKERVEQAINLMDVSSVASHMEPATIDARILEVRAIDPGAEFWGDRQAEAELARSQCLVEWPKALEAATKRVEDAAELDRLRQAEQDRKEQEEREAAQKREEEERQERERQEEESKKAAQKAAEEQERAHRQAREAEISRRLETEFFLNDDVSGAMPSYVLKRLLRDKEDIKIDDATWGNKMELAEAKKETLVTKLTNFVAEAVRREKEEADAAEMARVEQEKREKAEREANDAKRRDAMISEIAKSLSEFGTTEEMAEAIYDGRIPHVTITN